MQAVMRQTTMISSNNQAFPAPCNALRDAALAFRCDDQIDQVLFTAVQSLHESPVFFVHACKTLSME
jgi:hypothetical protein